MYYGIHKATTSMIWYMNIPLTHRFPGAFSHFPRWPLRGMTGAAWPASCRGGNPWRRPPGRPSENERSPLERTGNWWWNVVGGWTQLVGGLQHDLLFSHSSSQLTHLTSYFSGGIGSTTNQSESPWGSFHPIIPSSHLSGRRHRGFDSTAAAHPRRWTRRLRYPLALRSRRPPRCLTLGGVPTDVSLAHET